jgi:hypothetical protein
MSSAKEIFVSLLTSSGGIHQIGGDAIVIISGVRTPITKAKKGVCLCFFITPTYSSIIIIAHYVSFNCFLIITFTGFN